MKKQLLLGAALLAAISAFPQQSATKYSSQDYDIGTYMMQKYQRQINPVEKPGTAAAKKENPVYGPQENPAARSAGAAVQAPASWQVIATSANIYGSLVSTSRPLSYNDELNAVSFIHRISLDYTPEPPPISAAKSGNIYGVFTNDWGSRWDSTAIWNDNNYWGRYPQGGLWSMPGRTCLDSAYIIASGPVTGAATGWEGSFLASKQLDSIGGARNDDTAITGGPSHLFVSNSTPPFGKFDFPRLDFQVTDDGKVHLLGFLANDVNQTGAGYGWQGASVITGQFASGSFIWSVDTIIPDIFVNSTGSKLVWGTPHMAWNEAGDVGYVWFIGVRNPRPGQGDTLSNFGYQPIVYKTTDGGASWNELPRIDFNTTAGHYDKVFEHLRGVVTDPTLGIPWFFWSEGYDGIVDRNNRLHIVSTIISHARSHPDSLNYLWQYNLNGQTYLFLHEYPFQPYIFDFTETNQGYWNVTIIDSMSTEAPGETIGSDGYDYNPWDATGGTGTDRVSADARIQLSRSPDGRYIVYTWAESDTAFTFSGYKWNSLPNVKARLAEVGVESPSQPAALTVHPNEINITSPTNTNTPPYTTHPRVQDRAVMHYVSPKCAVISSTASSGVAIGLPIIVSNNNNVPFKQLEQVDHFYLSANLNFDNVSNVDWPMNVCQTSKPGDNTSVQEHSMLKNFSLFPNPANHSAQLSFNLVNDNDVEVTVINIVGQTVDTIRQAGTRGQNNVTVDLSNLSNGVYLLNVKAGEAKITTRLLVQH